MTKQKFTYRAFVSYSHQDHKWGVWLHRALEKYRIPKRMTGVDGLTRLGRCFRDEAEVGVATELVPKIQAALTSSDVLVVICSPNSAKSEWVNQEIQAFKNLGREHRVFAIIVDGTPNRVEDECFPAALKVRADGSSAEPLAADVRKFGKSDALVRLISGVLEVSYDELHQRELRRRRIRMVQAQAVAASAFLLTAAAGVGSWLAMTNYVTAAEQRSDRLAQSALELNRQGDPKALLLALYANPAAEGGVIESLLRPDGFSQARDALATVMTHMRLAGTLNAGGSVANIARTADGRTFAVAAGAAKLWSPEGSLIGTFGDAGDPVVIGALSPEGDRILTASTKGVLKLWPLEGKGAPRTLPTPESAGAINWVDFLNDGSLVSVSRYGSADLIDADAGEILATRSEFNVYSFEWSHGRDMVLTVGSEGVLYLASATEPVFVQTGSVVRGTGGAPDEVPGYMDEPTATPLCNCQMAIFSPDDKLVLAVDNERATIFRTEDGTVVADLIGHEREISSFAFSPDGSRIVTGSKDGAARIWAAADGRLEARFQPSGTSAVTAASFAADGSLVTGSADGVVRVWSSPASTPEFGFLWHDKPVDALAYSRDGLSLATGSSDGLALIWKAAKGDQQPVQLQAGRPILGLAFAEDGKFLFGVLEDLSVTTWPIAGEHDKPDDVGPQSTKTLAAISADRRHFAAWSFDAETVTVRSIPDAGLTRNDIEEAGEVEAIAISSDGGKLLVGYSDGSLVIRLASDGKTLMTLQAHTGAVRAAAFSPDGAHILTGGDDQTAKLWEVATGGLLHVFPSNGGSVTSVAFVPAQTNANRADLLLVASADREQGAVRLWRANRSEPLASFEGRFGPTRSIAFSPDGARVASGTEDTAVRVWSIPEVIGANKGRQVILACTRLKELGVTDLAKEDYLRFSVLDQKAPHPCRDAWGAAH